MLMEERLRLSSCFLLSGCGGKDTALSLCPHHAARGSGSQPLPVPLTLIQGWSRHSAAVMRCLWHRGRRWGWGSRPHTSTMGMGRWGWCWWGQRREADGSRDDGDGDVSEMKMEIEVGWR